MQSSHWQAAERRWDYNYTGGSTEDPRLTKLKDKKVGIIGTGATAVQAIPHLAKWAKELYVFQRTPSAVDRRDNRETDPGWWAQEITSRGKGWQWERMANYNAFISNVTPPPSINMVGDGWTKMPSYSVLVGGPNNMRSDFVTLAHELDLPRQEKIRARVDEIVKNQVTAQSLKAWYPGWCKRPTFHDEYLDTFNKPHVTLVDTDGRGISALTENGLLVNDADEYDVDLIVFSTGFELSSRQSPAARACFPVIGRGGEDMEHKWLVKGVATLHGCVSRDFPNMFYPGPNQGGAGPNQSYTLDMFSQHIAYIIAESAKRAAETERGKVTVEPTSEAEQAWAMEIARRARGMAAVSGCTPSYLNGEGAIAKPDATIEEMIKMAQLAPWGEGIGGFTALIEEWRNKGDMAGLEVKG